MSTRWQYQVVEIKPGLMGGFKQEVVQETLARHAPAHSSTDPALHLPVPPPARKSP